MSEPNSQNQYLVSVVDKEQLPYFRSRPEIAVVGRSNVGKSTLLNHLFDMKQLVKTSSTPGKTRALNFFSVEQGKWIAVDMPGYGFAQVDPQEKVRWGELITHYLNQRECLRALLWLFDIRREPNHEDLQMLSWIHHSSAPTILVLTKVDKVGSGEREGQTKRITCVLKGLSYVHYSAIKNIGRKELRAKLRDMVAQGDDC